MHPTSHSHGTHGADPSLAPGMAEFRLDKLDFDQRPILVFWESTRACLLACRHCRAEAIDKPLPGELSTIEARSLIDGLMDFGRPSPVLIITGGDVLMRPDVFDLVGYARTRGHPVGLSPSVTSHLTEQSARAMRDLGVKALSISLDGATAETHEGIRGVPGHFQNTLDSLKLLVSLGFTLQVNTTVMRDNVEELPRLAGLLKQLGVRIWEVFFLIQVGRGSKLREISAVEHEDVVHFLFDVSRHGISVRTVEAPFFRRVVAWRLSEQPGTDVRERYGLSDLYGRLRAGVDEHLGAGSGTPLVKSAGTRDGKGIIFVGYDGEIYPAGFLPVSLGNVRRDRLAAVYREHPLLKSIRSAKFSGRCGECEYADLCGGSRARAHAASGDALSEDPACPYRPRAG